MEQKRKTSFRKIVGIMLLLSIIAGSVVGIIYRQELFDYVALRNYTPSPEIVSLADQTTMRDKTRRVFYVNHPQLSDKATFRQNCPSGEHSIVLGCYIERRGIYLLDVTDQRLDGVIQVTAAHETLHAEYDRLSSDERARVDAMTDSFFKTLQNDRIKKTVEQYRAKDPSVVPNELHSILATEVRDLSPELEAYYSQYFTNRKQVVAFSEKYEQTFVGLNNQVDEYDAQLKELKQNIENGQKQIDALNTEIEQRKSRLDSLINSGQTEDYNDAVPEFNASVREYNALINQTKSQIADYNDIVEKRNSIVVTEQELVEAINSNITTKQTE